MASTTTALSARLSGASEVPPVMSDSTGTVEASLTAGQAADLTAGEWYVNLHTATNPNGEARGQLGVGP